MERATEVADGVDNLGTADGDANINTEKADEV